MEVGRSWRPSLITRSFRGLWEAPELPPSRHTMKASSSLTARGAPSHEAPLCRATALTARLDLSSYRRIMAVPTWGFVLQAIIATRSYAKGLEAGLLLLRFTEENRERLAPTEFESNRADLYCFLLDMLDRLYQWEAYLAAWGQIRAHTAYALSYSPQARLAETDMAPFILRRDPETLWVHFLWPTVYRKAVIERKVQAKRQRKRLGNLWHHPQDELSDEELHRRLEWVAHCVRTTWSWTDHSGHETGSDAQSGGPWTPSSAALSMAVSVDEEELVRELLHLEQEAAAQQGSR